QVLGAPRLRACGPSQIARSARSGRDTHVAHEIAKTRRGTPLPERAARDSTNLRATDLASPAQTLRAATAGGCGFISRPTSFAMNSRGTKRASNAVRKLLVP